MVKKSASSKKKGTSGHKKASSMPELSDCVKSSKSVNLPKITKGRENNSSANSSTSNISHPAAARILERLSELITSPWPTSIPSSTLPPRPPSASSSSRSSLSSKPDNINPPSLRRASDPPPTSTPKLRRTKSSRKVKSSSSLELRRSKLARRGSSDSSLPELSSTSGRCKISELGVDAVPVRRNSGEGEALETGGTILTRSAPGTPPISADVRTKIVKQCLALKRIMDKEGLHAESSIQKTLFSKGGPNIGVLIKCLRVLPDIDIAIIITNLLIRLTTSSELSISNAAFMTKKNLSIALLKCLHGVYRDFLKGDALSFCSAPNAVGRVDELMGNLMGLVVKMGKYETKMSLLARLHGAVPATIAIIRKWNERKEYGLMMQGFQALRVFAAKNDNNIATIHKNNIVPLIASLIRSSSIQSPTTQTLKLECLLDLLCILAKTKNGVSEILNSMSIHTFICLFKNASIETTQRAVLRVLKIIVETEEGKRAFAEDDGISILTNALDDLIQSSESGATILPTSPTSIPTLLVSVLRAAVSQSDLPFLERYRVLKFPLPSKTHCLPGLTSSEDQEEDEDYNVATEDVEKGLQPDVDENDPGIIHLLHNLCPELELLHGIPSHTPLPMGNIEVRHVQPMAPGRHFVCGMKCVEQGEPVYRRGTNLVRKSVYEQMTRVLHPNASENIVVYNVMDESVAAQTMDDTLLFESRFESGNLQLAIKISETEYDLLLQTDINTPVGKHNQWFYFSVQRMNVNVPYKFNIINMSKGNSQFNQGMQPVMFSKSEGVWRRVGEAVHYYKNHYRKPSPITSSTPDSDGTYATLTFTITFGNSEDICYLAYHYPYTYSDLQRYLFHLQQSPTFGKRCRRQTLCKTLGGNECVLLTITDFSPASTATHPPATRSHILLSARVHPGESNASHIMHGVLEYLLSDDEQAKELRQRCVFKVVPMLNPDGVVNGSHRCSLAGIDLNRQWKRPDPRRSPTIWWIKRLWRFLIEDGRRVLLACDFHGHSRRKNVFIFGCENTGTDIENFEKTFPNLLANLSPTFDLTTTRYDLHPTKETTARVVLWRELGIVNSFTLESSYCGADFGEKRGLQFQITDHIQMGKCFCVALRAFIDLPPWIVESGLLPTSNSYGNGSNNTTVVTTSISVSVSTSVRVVIRDGSVTEEVLVEDVGEVNGFVECQSLNNNVE